MNRFWLLPTLIPLLVAGCISGPGSSKETGEERILTAGIRNNSTIETQFACLPSAMVAQGCPFVEIRRVDSLCANEIPGYAGCNMTVHWRAVGGGVRTTVVSKITGPNETKEDACTTSGAGTCAIVDAIGATHHFGGAAETTERRFVFEASTNQENVETGRFRIWLNVTLHS